MNVVLWIVQILLAVIFLVAGVMKAFQYDKFKEKMPWTEDVSKNTVIFIGIVEILGSLGLWLPGVANVWQWLIPLSALGLAIIMILAAVLHGKRKESKEIGINVILLILAAFVVYGRWIALPLS